MTHRWYQPALNIIVITGAGLLILLAILSLIQILIFAFPLLLPFMIAIIVSFMMEPLVNVLQRRLRMGRGLAVFTAMLLVFGALGTALVLLMIQLVAELTRISAALPATTHEIKLYIDQITPLIIEFYGDLPSDITMYLHDATSALAGMLQSTIEFVVTYLIAFLSLLPHVLVFLIVTLLAIYFFAADKQIIAKFWVRLLPKPYGQKSLDVGRDVLAAFWSYLKAQSILITVTMIVSITGLYLIGAEYAVTIGLLVGLFDILPVLGPAGIFVPWATWLILTGDVLMAIKVLGVYAVVFVMRQLFEARVVAASMGLHPLAVLIAMYIGLKLMGFIGLILGPICLIAIQATLKASNILPKSVK